MTEGTIVRIRLAAAARRAALARFAETAVRTFAICALFLALALLVARAFAIDLPLDRLASALAAALGVGLAHGVLAARPDGAARSRLAVDLDREIDGGGLVLAAAAALGANHASRLAPLVLAEADRAVAGHRFRGSEPISVSAAGIGLGAVVLVALVALFERPSDVRKAAVDGIPGAPDATTANGPKPGAERTGERNPSTTTSALEELIRLEIRADHQVYKLGDEIRLTATMVPLAAAGRRIPLQVVLVATDGSLSPDRGFGAGLRVIPTGFSFAVPESLGKPLEATLPAKAALEAEGLYGRGLLTVFFAAAGLGEDEALGAVVSPRLTFQISENIERQRTPRPTPSPAMVKQPATAPKDGKPPPPKGQGGQRKPELGPKEELPEFERKAAAVKPLLNDAEQVEKEVEVFEREKGGTGAPPPVAPAPPEDPTRTLNRQAEEVMPKLDLSPRDRRMVGSYWDALRRRG